MSGGPRVILLSLKCELRPWVLSLLGKLEPRELGGQTGLDTDMHTEAHQGRSGGGKKVASEIWGNRTWGQCPGVVAGCPFEDPGTQRLEGFSSQDREGQRGQANLENSCL